MMIFSLVAMTGLEKCCITSAYLPWLCHSGERPVARGPLVSKFHRANRIDTYAWPYYLIISDFSPCKINHISVWSILPNYYFLTGKKVSNTCARSISHIITFFIGLELRILLSDQFVKLLVTFTGQQLRTLVSGHYVG